MVLVPVPRWKSGPNPVATKVLVSVDSCFFMDTIS